MRMIFGLIMAAAMLGGATPAAAEHWVRVGSDTDGGDSDIAVYVDADGITVRDGLRYAVNYNVHSPPIQGQVYASSVRSEYHCADNYFRTLEYSYFGARNEHLGTEPSETIDEHKIPPPESVSESTFRYVCEGTGGVPVADPWIDAQAILGRAQGK